ncbi:Transcription factor [Penicillium odoratum]|uniref:Transcription factor n=1 Tax=Penicillium odoratum TaxID=1167516 RepID=UPI002546E127|nr:Transcription factor [Penicillium odoratum]KAJ5777991.1 Transcription factor [Penicillium odoratum]
MDNFSTSEFSQESSLYSSMPTSAGTDLSISENSAPTESFATGDSSYIPRPKRVACVVCRRRKLRCDGTRPSCGTCSRLGHECAYDEVRKKSGPKRGYVKQLEARLAQVETLLKGQDSDAAKRTSPPQPQEHAFTGAFQDEPELTLPDLTGLGNDMSNTISPSANGLDTSQTSQLFYPPTNNIQSDPQWDLISLGLEEPLPAQDAIDELEAIFFEKTYPTMPIIHRPRYFANLNLGPNQRPPICLRYMMWSHAASVTDKYFFLHTHFYQRARKYAEADEMKGFGESIVTLGHCQTWILIGAYEFRMIYFPRAWLSVGKAARLALMMGLNRLDGSGIDVKQSMLPPKDWTEREERRRVFWMAFCCDRYASIGTGWPLVIDERDIMTNLPASEESFMKSKPQRTLRLGDIIGGDGVSTLAPFACVVVLANLFGRNLTHIHRPQPSDNDHDLNGDFWKRHRSHDNILLHIALSLPEHLRLPSSTDDVNVIFANMSIHTSTICLHQAAIFKAEKNRMPNQIITESKRRCLVAANQISSIMKMVSHIDLTILNPFMSFCLYISARVFVQYIKSRPDDSAVYSSLQFVVGALNAMKSKNPLTESFLIQLDVDLEGTGIRSEISKSSTAYAQQAMQTCGGEQVECGHIFKFQESQQSDTPQVPSQDPTNVGIPNRPLVGGATSLPSRHRESANIDANHRSVGLDQPHYYSNQMRHPGSNGDAGITGSVIDVDMDFSTEFSLGERNPPSDHPTPSTLNSSSNTSYSISGNDNPSPGKKQHTSGTTYSGQGSNTIHISPAGTGPPQIQDMNTRSGPASAFSIPPAWDLPTPSSDLNNVDFNVNVDSLSEAQWAQLLHNNGAAAGWDSWRPS